MKQAVLIVVLALGIVGVLGQSSCPCTFTQGRTCSTAVRVGSSGAADRCESRTVSCECHCVYDGSATDICLLDEGSTYVFTGVSDICESETVLVPNCGGGGTTVERIYVCADGVVTQGATSFQCVMPPLPCQTIIAAKLTYYQYAMYTANISFGPGTTQYQADITLVNNPVPASWFAGSLPGVQVTGTGIIDSEFGVTTVYREFENNATSLTDQGTGAYIAALNQNCNSAPTVFTVEIAFENNNANANFDDSPPRGVTAITGMAVVATVVV